MPWTFGVVDALAAQLDEPRPVEEDVHRVAGERAALHEHRGGAESAEVARRARIAVDVRTGRRGARRPRGGSG